MKNLKTLADRVKYAREKLGLAQNKIAKKVGLTQQSYNKIEKGIILRPRNLEKIAEVLKQTSKWLMFGEDDSIPIIFIPIIEWTEVKCKMNLLENKEMLPMLAKTGSKKSYALKIKYDSMISQEGKKSFQINDYIYVDPLQEPIHNDYVVAIYKNIPLYKDDAAKEHDGEPFFRQYFIEGDKKYLKPLNSNYTSLELTESIVICGVVTGSYSSCKA